MFAPRRPQPLLQRTTEGHWKRLLCLSTELETKTLHLSRKMGQPPDEH
ncbi:hypothetical protein VARIO8X_110168 [Burkholderiales bacterium 8X]|nr:hypothetical protein VARIO8X_110168 [Burkholderiales bacterium 8X]